MIKWFLLPIALIIFGTCFNCDCKKDSTIIGPPPPVDSVLTLRSPFWSSDGKRIIGISGSSGLEGDQFYSVDPAGGLASLLEKDSLAKLSPTLSPDGSMIAYLAAEVGRQWCCAHVWIMNADGTNPHDLTAIGGNWENLRWSPDSRTLIFDGGIDNGSGVNYQLVSANVQTGSLTQLTYGSFANKDGSFMSNGQKIAYLSGRIATQYGGKVFVMNVDGSNSLPVDTTSYASAFPRPSPMRNELIFVWGLGGESDDGEYLIDLDSVSLPTTKSNFHQIPSGAGGSEVQWSPDGNRLLFLLASSTIQRDLYVVDKYSIDIKRLTDSVNVSLFSYAWSPDNNHLVYAAENQQTSTFYNYTYDLQTNELKKLDIYHK